jgi:glycosyltransferase involved in cell wall biosynthesis
MLLRQFSALRRSHRERKVTLHIVGDGPLRGKLYRMAGQLQVMEDIRWHGWLDKNGLLKVYQQSDCFLNPSLYEGSPNTVLEAMACGLPVIASDIPGNNELVIHGETGFLFDLSKSSSLAEKVGMLIRDRALAFAMGRKARQKVETSYSWERVATAYKDLFCIRSRF